MRKTGLYATLLAGLVGWSAAPAAADTFRVTLAGGHANVLPWVRLLEGHFVPEVNRLLEGSGHSISWTQAYGGTVVKLGSEVDAVGDGIVTISYVPTSLAAGKVPLPQVTIRTPFGPDDPEVVVEAIDRLHDEIPAFNEMWDNYNVKYLAGGAVETYHIWSTTPINSVADLSGMKIAVPGAAANWLRGTGAVPVSGNLALYYTDVQNGVYDGVIVHPLGALSIRLHEVAKNISLVDFGAVYSFAMIVNKDAWEGFPLEVQEAIQTAGKSWSKELSRQLREGATAALQQMEDEGATLINLTDEGRAELAASLPNIAKEWAAELDAEGHPGDEILARYLDYMDEIGQGYARDWRAD